MKPAAFVHLVPDSLDDALRLLADNGEDAKVLAGGQSLVPLLNMRLATPEVLVDVSRLAELAGGAADDGVLRYGAGVVHRAFEDGELPDGSNGLLARVAAGIGYRAIRNRGTLGGSLAHADASAEWPVVMAALGADVVIAARAGERRVPAGELVVGPLMTELEAEEMIVAVEVPALGPGASWGFVKAARKEGEFAESLAVVLVSRADDGSIDAASAWLGAAGDVPLRLGAVEDALCAGEDDVLASAAEAVGERLGAPADPERRYRHHLHALTVARAATQALAKAQVAA